jgi:mono/diheme cytochrome c family protein
MECHNTFAKTISPPGKQPEEFDSTQIIYAVGCEKCHGPAAAHVKFQTENPSEKKGKYIINPAIFSRQQSLDYCVLCHGGRLQKSKPSFEFIPGDTLSNYFTIDPGTPDPAKIDVHGNQYGLLRASKCFIMSNTLTCTTCHNSHENERGSLKVFSERCMSCHSEGHDKICKMKKSLGNSINNNCIDCHMPVKTSNVVTVFLPHSNEPTAALIRTHFIAIYPEEAKKGINSNKQ